jgi:hypothetical protein
MQQGRQETTLHFHQFIKSPHRKLALAVLAGSIAGLFYISIGWPSDAGKLAQDPQNQPVVSVPKIKALKVSRNAQNQEDPAFDSNINELLDSAEEHLKAAKSALQQDRTLVKSCVGKKGASRASCSDAINNIRNAVFAIARAESIVDTYSKNGKVSTSVLKRLESSIIQATNFHETYPKIGPQLTVHGVSDPVAN